MKKNCIEALSTAAPRLSDEVAEVRALLAAAERAADAMDDSAELDALQDAIDRVKQLR